jgi:mannose-6-phosphate isomerase
MNLPLPNYEHSSRPWGQYERFTLNEQTTVKLISVHAGEVLSLQTHEKRSEFWRCISGLGVATVGESTVDLRPGIEVFIEQGVQHRVAATAEDLLFLEIAFGTFDEEDILRLDDKYGRT